MAENCCDPNIDAVLLAKAKVVYVASVVVMDEDGRILIAKRPKGKHLQDYWEFPGGKIEEGETPQKTVVRELQEEVGLTTCAGCLYPLNFVSYAYEDFHLLMPVFICRQFKGQALSKEGQDIAWVYKKDLKNYTMAPANDVLLTTIRDTL